MFIRQNEDLRSRARELRNHMTPQEKLLWNTCLKHCPTRVYRQYLIENYIVDFFCRRAGVVIEVDGMQHYSMKGMAYDKKRSSRIEAYDILVLRFSNLDIEHNLGNVSQYILRVIEERMKEREGNRSTNA